MASSAAEKKISKYSRLDRNDWKWGYLFIIPNFLGFMLFFAVPVVYGLVISLTNYNGFDTMDFVGVENFVSMFEDKFFITALKNNLYYSALYVPFSIFFALIFALAVNSIERLNGFFRTIFYFPSITAVVAIGIVWGLLFAPRTGPINTFLMSLGVENPPKWIAATSTAMISITIVMVWKNAGYYMIMFLGGLKSIPRQLYEAARIDGANSMQTFRHITWPMLSPTTFMIFILSFISSFQVFDAINIMTEGGPGRATTVIVYLVYDRGFIDLEFGYASAMAYFLFGVILLITFIQFLGQKKWVVYD